MAVFVSIKKEECNVDPCGGQISCYLLINNQVISISITTNQGFRLTLKQTRFFSMEDFNIYLKNTRKMSQNVGKSLSNRNCVRGICHI